MEWGGTDPGQIDVHHATFNLYPISLLPPACLSHATMNTCLSPEITVKYLFWININMQVI